MSKSLRWSEANHADWKRREAERNARIVLPVVGEANAHESAPAEERAILNSSGDASAGRGPSRIVLPWPPSGNHGTRHANGAHYLTAEHIDYRMRVLDLVRGMRIEPIVGRLRVTVHFAPPDRRRADLDNRFKVLGDALQHAGVYKDDAAIDELHLYRTPIVKGGAVNVCVEAIA